MSVNFARSRIESIQRDIARYQKDKGDAAGKAAAEAAKASAAFQAAQRSSGSSAGYKMRDYEQHQKAAADAQKKVADCEERIAREYEKLSSAQKDLEREEDHAFQERQREDERRQREAVRHAHEVEARMRGVTTKLREHDSLHRDAMDAIERLSRLPERITVLFLASNPIDQPQLRLDEEARAIEEMIRKSEHRDAVAFRSCWAVRPLDVLQAINQYAPQVVHFSGHGSDANEIVFQDPTGNAKLVSQEAIVQTMQAGSDGIRLVFFNICSSAGQAAAVVKHVEAAIGMRVPVGDDAARVFAAQFYSAVGFGKSVKRAFEQARAALMLEGIAEEDTPILEVAVDIDPDQVILVRPPSASLPPAG